MKRLYLFTLEIAPLDVGSMYDELPSHLTLMSRFISNLSPESLADTMRPLFAGTAPVLLKFGKTVELGPKRVIAHMVDSPDELQLHQALRTLLDTTDVMYEYPEFIGNNHRPHVNERRNVTYKPGDEHLVAAAYLIEIVDKRRLIRAKFTLSGI